MRTKSVPLPAALNGPITVSHVYTGDEVESTATGARSIAIATIQRTTPTVAILSSTGAVTSTFTVSTTGSGAWVSTLDFSVSVTAHGRLAQSTLPATTPSTFPTGTYLVTSKASPYKYGYLQITAITVNIDSTLV
jgi:hypothetical protein